jgi:hypothetical protein
MADMLLYILYMHASTQTRMCMCVSTRARTHTHINNSSSFEDILLHKIEGHESTSVAYTSQVH